MTKKLREAVRQQKQATNQKKPQLHGLLGLPLGGSKVVEVANRNSYVYVRLRNNQSEVIQAFNNQVAPAYNLPVIVERHGNRYTVIGVDTQRYENNWSSFAPFLPRHGNTHSFDMESGGGGDVVWVHTRQFMPMLVLPSGSAGAPNVIVSPYTLRKDNGTWIYVGNTGTQNVAPYRPSTGAIMGLVYLNTNDGNPYLIINSGTIFPESLTGASQVVPYIPQIQSPSTQIPLAAIRLVTGTNRLSWDNIYDVRQFLHSVPTGTGGGGGSATGSFDDIYLRLDATNDPITGPTDIAFTGDLGSWGLTVNTVQASPMRFSHVLTGTGAVEDSSIRMTRSSSVGGAGLSIEGAIIRVSQFLNASDTDTGGLLLYTSQGVQRVLINPSVQGTGTMVMFDSDNSLNNNANLLLLKHEGNPKWKVNARGDIEFGLGIAKELNAGKIGYEVVAPGGYLDIIGAGTETPRWVRIYDRLRVEHAQVESFQNLGLVSSWIYLDATGTAVTPINAPEATVITGSHRILGMNPSDVSVQFSVNDLAEGIVYREVLSSFLNATSIPASTTYFSCPGRVGADATAFQVPWVEGGTLTDLYFRTSIAQPASGSLVATLQINGVDTALVATVPAGSAAGTFTNTSARVNFSAGDLVRWKFVNNATASSANMTSVAMRNNKRATA